MGAGEDEIVVTRDPTEACQNLIRQYIGFGEERGRLRITAQVCKLPDRLGRLVQSTPSSNTSVRQRVVQTGLSKTPEDIDFMARNRSFGLREMSQRQMIQALVMLRFLQRLKQRKIVQWVIGYFAGAWIALEVFDLIAEQFLWPAWIRQASTILVLFGGLVTIVLAWYHGERGRQKVGAVEFVMLVVILAVGGQSIWLLKGRSDRLEAESSQTAFQFRDIPPPEQSVAVLPCANLSDDEQQRYFADGLAAELITRLAAVSGLRIPSREDIRSRLPLRTLNLHV